MRILWSRSRSGALFTRQWSSRPPRTPKDGSRPGSQDGSRPSAQDGSRPGSQKGSIPGSQDGSGLPTFNPAEETGSARERRPSRTPGESSVFLFPGQGSQFVGMGRGLLKYPKVKEMFSAAEQILGYDLLSLCLRGPEDQLMRTIHCQPAVFVTSLAAVERLNHENPKVPDRVNPNPPCGPGP